MEPVLTDALRDELAALKAANDARGGAAPVGRHHWHDSGYADLVHAHYVFWGDPPKDIDPVLYAGATITDKGCRALAARE